MNINDFTDEIVEEVIKDIPRRAKAQIFGTSKNNVSDVTGKPIPKKQIVSKIAREIDELDAIKLKKMREDFDKMKLQVTDQKSLAGKEGQGPEMLVQKPQKQQDDAVSKMLRNSKSTGEVRDGGG